MNINPIKIGDKEELEKLFIFNIVMMFLCLPFLICGLFFIPLGEPSIGVWVTIVVMGCFVGFGVSCDNIRTRYYILNADKKVKKK